jgi:hypothetical protein
MFKRTIRVSLRFGVKIRCRLTVRFQKQAKSEDRHQRLRLKRRQSPTPAFALEGLMKNA